jgi:hypothetical protein
MLISKDCETVILCGLFFEARIASWIKGAEVVCSDSNPQRAHDFVRVAIQQGTVKRMMGFGIAGGLDPELPAGTVVVASHIVSKDQPWSIKCDAAWSRKLLQRMPDAQHRFVYGGPDLLSKPSDKKQIFDLHGAATTDMESHCLIAAAKAGMEIAAVRVISDSAHHYLPPDVVEMIRPGGMNWGSVYRGIRREPKGTYHAAVNTARALPGLMRAAYHLNR